MSTRAIFNRVDWENTSDGPRYTSDKRNSLQIPRQVLTFFCPKKCNIVLPRHSFRKSRGTALVYIANTHKYHEIGKTLNDWGGIKRRVEEEMRELSGSVEGLRPEPLNCPQQVRHCGHEKQTHFPLSLIPFGIILYPSPASFSTALTSWILRPRVG